MKWLAAGVLVAIGAGAMYLHAHLVENLTASLPTGLYWRASLPESPPPGTLGIGCATPEAVTGLRRAGIDVEHGPCLGDSPLLIKVIVASEGARVEVRHTGVRIDGKLLAGSALTTDRHGRLVPAAADRRLRHGEYWFWSPVPASLDSRYLGPIRATHAVIPTTPFAPDIAARLTPRFLVASRF